MAQVDARKAGKPYKGDSDPGRKDADGTTMVINYETLQNRTPDLIALRVAAAQSNAKYTEAINAVAKASGLLSTVVGAFIRAKAGKAFLDAKRKADQLSLVFTECGQIDDAGDPNDGETRPEQGELGAGAEGEGQPSPPAGRKRKQMSEETLG